MRKFGIIAVALVAIFIFSGTVFAASSGWSQRFQIVNAKPFNTIGVFWLSEDKFDTKSPGNPWAAKWALSDFSAPGWFTLAAGENFGYAVGPTVTTNYYNINFAPMDNFNVDFLSMTALGSEFVYMERITHDNLGWHYTQITDTATWYSMGGGSPIATPEPVSSALFLLGGAALAARKMRKKKNVA